MGGGSKSSSKTYQTTYDNDMVASDGGVVIGEGAYAAEGDAYALSLGDGASYINNAMDDNTAALLSNSNNLLHDLSEDVLEIYAQKVGAVDEAQIDGADTESLPYVIDARTDESSAKTELLNKILIGVTAGGGLLWVASLLRGAKS